MDRKTLMAEWPKNGNDVSAAVQLAWLRVSEVRTAASGPRALGQVLRTRYGAVRTRTQTQQCRVLREEGTLRTNAISLCRVVGSLMRDLLVRSYASARGNPQSDLPR
jgi:hypothetical protein